MDPFDLEAYGNWAGEMREIERRLDWQHADEVGKFYDHTGDDTFYYYVYASRGRDD